MTITKKLSSVLFTDIPWTYIILSFAAGLFANIILYFIPVFTDEGAGWLILLALLIGFIFVMGLVTYMEDRAVVMHIIWPVALSWLIIYIISTIIG